ncbi:hypothetical protein SARC_18167, partial [Sphaeroforma arctica JP610]
TCTHSCRRSSVLLWPTALRCLQEVWWIRSTSPTSTRETRRVSWSTCSANAYDTTHGVNCLI